jgi:hypothetical protein
MEAKLVSVANVGNYKAIEDWWFYLPAILFVDTFIIFLCRFFPKVFGLPINQWYDDFGLAAVLSDVTIIAIGIAIARYIYTAFFMEEEGWSLLYFIGLAVIIQIVHDMAFAFGVVQKIPRGHNSMIDVFKQYATEKSAGAIVGDSALVIGTCVLAMILKSIPNHITAMAGVGAAYTIPFILETKNQFSSIS